LVISLLPVLSRVQRFTLSTAKSAISMRKKLMQSVDIVEFSAGPGLAPSIRAQTAVDPWHHTQHDRVAGAALVCLNVRLGYTFFKQCLVHLFGLQCLN
jgi:hypothetical protein